MTRLPLAVISGYLGAGKTTLINRMLAEPHGLRLMVMVNDFGAINIDAALIARQTEDVIALTNGCVCCTMGADLFMAIGDVLDRADRPDHLIIEASGIADPRAVANLAIAEPELRYAGIVTLVDFHNISDLLDDPLVSHQVHGQIACADLVVLTKSEKSSDGLDTLFTSRGLPTPVALPAQAISLLMLDAAFPPASASEGAGHVDYVRWQHQSEAVLPIDKLMEGLGVRPPGLFRLKGFLRTDAGGRALHVVGSEVDLAPIDQPDETELVGLGPRGRVEADRIERWWSGILTKADRVGTN